MPESSSDKTTRKFISVLNNPSFCYQISIFYNNYSDRLNAPIHKPIITDQLPRTFPRQPFLYRLGIKEGLEADALDDLKDGSEYGDYIDMPYHTLFTIEPTEITRLKVVLERRLGCSLRLKRRCFNGVAKSRYVSALQSGEAHDLIGYFPSLKFKRRVAVINKSFLSE